MGLMATELGSADLKRFENVQVTQFHPCMGNSLNSTIKNINNVLLGEKQMIYEKRNCA